MFSTAATHKKIHKLILDECKCDKARQRAKYQCFSVVEATSI